MIQTENSRSKKQPLLLVDDLVVEFETAHREVVHAVSNINFAIQKGETLGLVGESGCGKSTAARAIMQLPTPTSGTVSLEGTDLTKLSPAELRSMRQHFQMIFQDPIASLNPRKRVADIVAAPLRARNIGNVETQMMQVSNLLDAVGLDPAVTMAKRPHEFSGGQCQRISIARAVVLEPKLLICDEPVSALDVSIQAQILNLLEEMKQRYHLTMLFISHDLAVVRNIADRVAVMYLGRICEIGPADLIYENPLHPYTEALLSAIPIPDPDIPQREIKLVEGDLPSPIKPPSGCRFRTRCPAAQSLCSEEVPKMRPTGGGRLLACHFPLDN